MQKEHEEILQHLATGLMAPSGQLESLCIRWIQEKVRAEKSAHVEWVDFGFDCSSYGRQLDEHIDVSAFEIIRDFLDYPTGHSMPTYESGSGMRAETYEDIFIDFIRDTQWDWLAQQDYKAVIFYPDGLICDEFTDVLCDSTVNEYAYCESMAEKPFPSIRLVQSC